MMRANNQHPALLALYTACIYVAGERQRAEGDRQGRRLQAMRRATTVGLPGCARQGRNLTAGWLLPSAAHIARMPPSCAQPPRPRRALPPTTVPLQPRWATGCSTGAAVLHAHPSAPHHPLTPQLMQPRWRIGCSTGSSCPPCCAECWACNNHWTLAWCVRLCSWCGCAAGAAVQLGRLRRIGCTALAVRDQNIFSCRSVLP